MKFFKSVIFAFSMYSRISVPNLKYDTGDTKYSFCAFPLVGVVIGLLLFGWHIFCNAFDIGKLAFVLIGTAIPVLVTGGFHVDGFMDTMDAVCSYKDMEDRLKIMSDSHIGAFAVIRTVIYYIVFIAGMSELKNLESVIIVCIGFVVSRSLSGIGAITFKQAGNDDLLKEAVENTDKTVTKAALILVLILSYLLMLYVSIYSGILVLFVSFICFFYYRYFCIKQFDGITGDTAGCFLLVCEEAIVLAAAIGGRF